MLLPFYLILIKTNEPYLSLGYVVSLPSSFMIVISFTPSYSLLAYMLKILGTVFYLLILPAHFPLKNVVLLSNKNISHRHNLQIINLEAVTLYQP